MDEDSQARAQLNLLRADGHDVVAIGELAKNGTPDPEVFDLAQLLERVLLTHNAEDFHAQIVVAIRRLETLRMTIAGDFHVLNHWL